MIVVGLDVSLTQTGFASSNGHLGVITPKTKGCERLIQITDTVEKLIEPAALVVIEGYAFSRSNQAHQLGEIGGCIRAMMFRNGVPFVEVPPSKLKKFATGKGNANKALMMAEAIRRLGYAGHNDNEADALWLLEMARNAFQMSPVKLPKPQSSLAFELDWPEPRR